MSTLFTIEHKNGEYVVREKGCVAVTCNTEKLAECYIQARQDILEAGGLEGAMEKWWKEEAKQRRKLGLPVKADYRVTHHGTSKWASCGVHKGVEGNLQLEVMDHTMDWAKTTCPECLEKHSVEP